MDILFLSGFRHYDRVTFFPLIIIVTTFIGRICEFFHVFFVFWIFLPTLHSHFYFILFYNYLCFVLTLISKFLVCANVMVGLLDDCNFVYNVTAGLIFYRKGLMMTTLWSDFLGDPDFVDIATLLHRRRRLVRSVVFFEWYSRCCRFTMCLDSPLPRNCNRTSIK